MPREVPSTREPARYVDEESFISPLVKWSLFAFNFIFWIAGGVLVAIGTWAFAVKQEASGGSQQISSLFDLVLTPSILVILLGCIVFLIGFAGCLGALRENLYLLKIFAWALLVLFVLECVLGIVGFIFSDIIKEKIRKSITEEVLIRYRDDLDLQNFIDFLQLEFKCCGISSQGYKDWNQNMYFNCTETNKSPENCGVPYSCCVTPTNIVTGLINKACGHKVQNKSFIQLRTVIHTRGCLDAVLDSARHNLYVIAGVVLGIALPQLLGIFLSRTLIVQIEQQKERWGFQ